MAYFQYPKVSRRNRGPIYSAPVAFREPEGHVESKELRVRSSNQCLTDWQQTTDQQLGTTAVTFT